MSDWKSKNHFKYLLQYHLILVCKYRKKLLVNEIDSDVKELLIKILSIHDVNTKYIESDIDHIHLCIETEPDCNLSNLIRTVKSYTTYHIWRQHPELSKYFWKEKTFWTNGSFVCSIGNVSENILKEYIENQGKE